MGMFDKDKEIGRDLTLVFNENEEFVLIGVKIEEKSVQTDLGKADKTTLTVRRIGGGEEFEVTSLGSAIANKSKEADPKTDFPAVVCWLKVKSKQFGNDATVLQFIRPA